MKSAMRTILFAYLAVAFSQKIIPSIYFTGPSDQGFYLLVLAISALYFFSKPLLRILSFPSSGIGFTFMSFIMTFILFYALAAFVPVLIIVPAELSNLIIFGFVIPSKSLTAFVSGALTSLIIAVVYNFLDWLCQKEFN